LISFSCSAGSLSASTPLLPNDSHWAKPWKDLALLVGDQQKWLSTTAFLDKVDANLKKAMAA